PERLALSDLGLTKDGAVITPYNDQAFQVWYDDLRSAPGNLRTLHHVAIMHHARAIDREKSNTPQQSDEDWQKALEYWHRLWSADEFWARVAEIACKNGSQKDKRAVVELRERFPVLLLRMH